MQQIADDRGRNVVRKVRNEQESRLLADAADRLTNLLHQFGSQRVLVSQRVAVNQSNVGAALEFLTGELMQIGIDFDAKHRAGLIRQTCGQ